MNPAQFEAMRILQARYFDVFRLAGDSNKAMRQYVMTLLTGTKMPIAKCGVTAIREECRKLISVSGKCEAAREHDFATKAAAILAQTAP